MEACGAAFPDVHLDGERMARLAEHVSLEAGFDMVFPVFSVVQEAAALGAEINWGARDAMPTIERAVWEDLDQVAVPRDFETRPSMAATLEAIRVLRDRHGHTHAVVGKVFGPWSLAYHMFGVETVLMMSVAEPDRLGAILDRLCEATLRSAVAQACAGAHVLCLADHCSREMCSPSVYRDLLLPRHRMLSRRIPCPVVLHTCGDTSDRIPMFAETGFDCFHYDTRVPAVEAVRLAGGRISLMGGVSNVASLLHCDEGRIATEVAEAMRRGVDIIGPECAIPLRTPVRALKALSEAVRNCAE
jgi:[methyl-Co(III) methanol-specific corrinoid protein]:coenzyme M methyltransferase